MRPGVAAFLAALLVAAPLLGGVPAARAEEPSREELAAHAVRSAFAGSWDDAWRWRQAWHGVAPGRLDGRGLPIGHWRPRWALEAGGGLEGAQDEAEARRLTRVAADRLLTPTTNLEAERSAEEPFGAVLLLAYERAWREVHGMARGPAASPLSLLPDPDRRIAHFLAWQREAYSPTPPEQSADAAWAAQAKAAREQAETHRSQAHRAALLAAGLLLALTLLLGWRLGRTRASAA